MDFVEWLLNSNMGFRGELNEVRGAVRLNDKTNNMFKHLFQKPFPQFALQGCQITWA